MFTTQNNEVFQAETDGTQLPTEISETELVEKYQLEDCVKWITDNNYERTCLQFPETLLNDGVSIALYIQKKLKKTVYILGDTNYGSCCVDEVAAEHVKGDSIIHFGHACLSPVVKLPVLYVFHKGQFSPVSLYSKLKHFGDDTTVIIFYDDIYNHVYTGLCDVFKDSKNIHVTRLVINKKEFESNEKSKVLCGRIFPIVSETNIHAVYLGDECTTLENLILNLPDFKWYYCKGDNDKLTECQFNNSKYLMKRAALVEKVKEAQTVGILIGTLGIKNYLDAIDRIKELVVKNGKKCYKLAVGKPNVAKLANFPEIDVFVCLSCQENSLLKDFKGYYKPIVSLIEIEMALGNRPYDMKYTLDFRELLEGGSFYKELSVTTDAASTPNDTSVHFKDLAERNPGTLAESSGAQFLLNRTWKGLEQNLGETEVRKAVKGRSGTAQSYENELTTLSEEEQQQDQE